MTETLETPYVTQLNRYKAEIDHYVANRRWPDSRFLQAILENDLKTAIFQGGPENVQYLRDLVMHVHWEIPSGCHGDKAAVSAWVQKLCS